MTRDSRLDKQLRSAIKYFWSTREVQAQKQGASSGSKDAGARSAVTGGAQMNGFINIVRDLLCENGLPRLIFTARSTLSCRAGIGRRKSGICWSFRTVSYSPASSSNLRSVRLATITTTAARRRLGARPMFGPPIGRELSSRPRAPGWVT